MDFKKISSKNFSDLTKSNKKNSTELAGRFAKDEGCELSIFNDILEKLELHNAKNILDIGCGCGPLSDFIIDYCKNKNINLIMLDISEVVSNIKAKHKESDRFRLIDGVFPVEKLQGYKFDSILLYSVVQYSNDPMEFIQRAYELLDIQGRMFIGDIPNIDKKARFLMSKKGMEFESNYQGIEIDQLYKFSSYDEFRAYTGQNIQINDAFILEVIKRYRSKFSNAYILEEPMSLPFCHTREDVIIERLQ